MGTIKTRRIKDDVIMNVRLIRMSRYNKSMIAFGKSHDGFIAYLIRFLGVISPGLKDCRI